MFMEAKWFNEGYTPSLQEYLSNAWVSSSGTVISVHSFFSVMTELETGEISNFLEKNQDLVYNISIIIRLCNDLGTSVVIIIS
jgi:alpha-farnesene synthase